MNQYKVSYIIKTTSRCGSYLYKYNDIIEANNESEIKQIIKSKEQTFKRFTVIIKSIKLMA